MTSTLLQSSSDLSSASPLSMTLADARADGRSRTVWLSRERVTIDRHYRGVAMRLSVPVGAYRGVCVGIRPAATGGVTYELRLAHRDDDLSVSLAEAPDERDVWADWRIWARFFGLPTLIERNDGLVEWSDAPGCAGPGRVGPAAVSAPKRRLKRRRAAFVVRRHAARGVPPVVHREAEIIARA